MSRVAELPLSLNEIHRLYPALVRALAEAGESGARMQEILDQHLKVRCVGCHQAISGEELAQLALDPEGSPAANPRIERLRLGYCARPECNSRFYQATADSGMVAWPKVFQRTRHFIDHPPASTPEPGPKSIPAQAGAGTAVAAAGQPEVSEPEPPTVVPFAEQWRRLQYATLAAIVLVGLLFWWWHSGARIPGISPTPRQFEVISAPGSPSIGPAPSSAPATNAPRSFRVQ